MWIRSQKNGDCGIVCICKSIDLLYMDVSMIYVCTCIITWIYVELLTKFGDCGIVWIWNIIDLWYVDVFMIYAYVELLTEFGEWFTII